ncbi:transcriptional regulator PadR-like protein, partial [Pseudomonas syringae pv. japonica str. M301072]
RHKLLEQLTQYPPARMVIACDPRRSPDRGSLALIAEQPAHGYDLIRKIEGLFEGAYCPSPGVIYPTLTFLEESEMVV